MATDPCEILGIDRDADAEAVRTAYRKAALRCHPDVFDGDPEEAERLFRQVTAAYKTILRRRAARSADPRGRVYSPRDLAAMQTARAEIRRSASRRRTNKSNSSLTHRKKSG